MTGCLVKYCACLLWFGFQSKSGAQFTLMSRVQCHVQYHNEYYISLLQLNGSRECTRQVWAV